MQPEGLVQNTQVARWFIKWWNVGRILNDNAFHQETSSCNLQSAAALSHGDTTLF
jgi:hypothetical protein